jgi:hypothetical protein
MRSDCRGGRWRWEIRGGGRRERNRCRHLLEGVLDGVGQVERGERTSSDEGDGLFSRHGDGFEFGLLIDI